MQSVLDRIRAVHSLQDGKQRSARERSYSVYLTLLVCTFILLPLIAGLSNSLTESGALDQLVTSQGKQWITTAGLLTLGGFGFLGGVQGPAVLPPFMATTLLATEMPRRAVLRQPFQRASVVLTASIIGLSFPVAYALAHAKHISIPTALASLLGAAVFGSLASTVWALGQRLGPTKAWCLLIFGAGTCALPWLAPISGGAVNVILLLGTILTAALLFLAIPRALNSMDGHLVVAQSVQRERAKNATQIADLSGALALFRAVPRRGRPLLAVRNVNTALRFICSDLVGAIRTPLRFTTGAVALVAGSLATVFGLSTTGAPAGALLVSGAALSYAGLGVFGDGFRYAAALAFAPRLFRNSTRHLYLLHGLLPLGLSLVTTALVTLCVRSVFALTTDDLIALLVLSVFLTLTRAYDSAKGPLPAALLSPVYSPGGDLSGVAVILWQFDAVLIAVVLATVALLAPGPALLGLSYLGGGCFLMGLLLSLRLKHL